MRTSTLFTLKTRWAEAADWRAAVRGFTRGDPRGEFTSVALAAHCRTMSGASREPA